MTAADFGSLASAFLALLALIVSIISMRKSNKFGKTADRLNLLLINKEQEEGHTAKRADISANLIKVGKSDYRLKVFNRGKGTARNVKLTDLDGENSIIIAGSIEEKFPVPILEQHQSIELITFIGYNSKFRTHIKLEWDDETGSGHMKELTPSC